MKIETTIKDIATGEVLVIAPLSKTRINALILLGLILWGLDHLNWVGDHYCFKSSLECYFPEGGSK